MELRKMFEEYDTDHSGRISYPELGRLVRSMFPVLEDGGIRVKLTSLLKEVDNDFSGSLDFQDFLRIFRQFSDLKQMENASKETRAVEATKFTAEEVSEFRQLFRKWYDHKQQELGLEQFLQMIDSCCELTRPRLQLLTTEFSKVRATRSTFLKKAPKPAKAEDDKVDFPEYLRLMRSLVDMNFMDFADAHRLSQVDIGKLAPQDDESHSAGC
eukprot:UN3912